MTHEKVLKTLNDMVLYFTNKMNQQEKNDALSNLTQEAYSRFIEAATLARIRLIALADKIEQNENISEEKAIEVLHKSGWMMAHDAEMTRDDTIPSLVNRIMLDGNKSIAVNIYPWKGEENA